MRREKRQELLKQLRPLLEEGARASGTAHSIYEMGKRELLMRKYRISCCIKLLQKFGFSSATMKNVILPDTEEIFRILTEEEMEEEDYEFYEFNRNFEQTDVLIELGKRYLECILQDTDWNIFYAEDAEDYEKFPEEILKKAGEAVSIHLGLISGYNAYQHSSILKEESRLLEQCGIKPHEKLLRTHYFCPDENLILTNARIEEMLCICKTEEKYCQWTEYKDIREISDFCLLDARIPQFSASENLKTDNWSFINYIFGEICDGNNEHAGMHLLNYETVILLLLADMIAEDFLKKHRKEKAVKR